MKSYGIVAEEDMTWSPSFLAAKVGDEIEFRLGGGTHALFVSNWSDAKDALEIIPVDGQFKFDGVNGRSVGHTSEAGKVLARFKVTNAATLTYYCFVHGPGMSGVVSAT